MPQPPVALYVHLPFCVARCPYCDFVVYAGGEARGPRARTERLYEAVGRELEMRADALDERFGRPDGRGRPDEGGRPDAGGPRRPLDTVYFGGGTPSLVPAEWLERLMATVRRRYGLAPDAEVTLEANPGPDERGDMAAFAAAGVNRVSFGAQSMNDGELRRLGRRHSPGDVATAVARARAAGIGSVNLDLLYDVPGQTVAGWEATPAGRPRSPLGPPLALRADARRPRRRGSHVGRSILKHRHCRAANGTGSSFRPSDCYVRLPGGNDESADSNRGCFDFSHPSGGRLCAACAEESAHPGNRQAPGAAEKDAASNKLTMVISHTR